ncbi:three-Cys-motif partner protein TcmP [Thalassospira sp. CH_XMU1458]|uniref:three-Cys-motif partner protein TcmP n=1 Tax=Thalassospira sp. CH_XMU1458 TaxID=3107776 RepID=UPI00300D3AE3
MSQTSKIFEADDGLPASEVGVWACEKHDYLSRYLNISRKARQKFLSGRAKSATFVDLFCGSGRARIRNTNEWVDGSAVAAWKISRKGEAPFSTVYISDIDPTLRSACAERLRRLGAPVVELEGDAVAAAKQYVQAVNEYGLNFAFIDPFSLGTLSFEIIQTLSQLKRIDMLIHFSKMDHQRNLGLNLTSEKSDFDALVPGWRDRIDQNRPMPDVRRQIFELWRDMVAEVGLDPSLDVKLITGSRNQHLYWLLIVAKHQLALKFWKEATANEAQGNFFGSLL